MHYFVSQFDKDGKTFSQDVSMLPGNQFYGDLPNGTAGITLTDPVRGEVYTFLFYCKDMDASNEDTHGWRFVVNMDTVTKFPHMQGHRVLIVND